MVYSFVFTAIPMCPFEVKKKWLYACRVAFYAAHIKRAKHRKKKKKIDSGKSRSSASASKVFDDALPYPPLCFFPAGQSITNAQALRS